MDFTASKMIRRKSLLQSALLLIETRLRIAHSLDRIRKSRITMARAKSPYARLVWKAELN